MTETAPSYKNHFLIAMPRLNDSYFEKTVTYLCEHNEDGAMGIVVNMPLSLSENELFEHLKITADGSEPAATNETLVFEGGPVEQSHGFVLHESDQVNWRSSLNLGNGISITTSEDILEALANHKGPQKHLIALGFAGWSEGQLEQEIADNSWLLVEAKPEIIFDTPTEKRWDAATRLLGIEPSQLSDFQGHG